MSGSLRQRVHRRLLDELEPSAAVERDVVLDAVGREAPLLTPDAAERVVAEVLSDVVGLGPLDPLVVDPAVSEVMVNGPGPVWIERHGRLECTGVVVDTDVILHLIERVVSPLGLRADRSCPLVDARLSDGSRVNVVVPPLAVDGPCLTIRRFTVRAVPLDDVCPPGVADLLRHAVRTRANVVVSGGTGAGKTTLLNALAGEIPRGERIITVEDAAELSLSQDHVVRLEARPANAEGAGEVRIRELVRNALRMRPDRIVVGEVRGPEALDMLQAMNTGHEGSLSTCHANSPVDAVRRIETMVLMGSVALPLAAVRQQLRAAVDLVVQVRRGAGGLRRVVTVAEVEPDGATVDDGRAVAVRVIADETGVVAQAVRPARWDS
ncbi:MAG TPA: CpaF family protein [Acidimicrobiales bacterium]|nr:CpaF family protein [Acidimicrobiales bacterium]